MTAELKRGLGGGGGGGRCMHMVFSDSIREVACVCVCVCVWGGGVFGARYEKWGAPDRIAASFGLIQNVR